jgi:hypothetical protein
MFVRKSAHLKNKSETRNPKPEIQIFKTFEFGSFDIRI